VSFWRNIKSFWPGRKKNLAKGTSEDLADNVMREFVYLDEVSLRSLLSSQKGGVTDSTSEQRTSGRQAELEGKASVESAFLAKAEVASRYQTSNSSTVQTSRKATVQSWFREFLAIPGLRTIHPPEEVKTAKDLDDVKRQTDPSTLSRSADLQRGALVEFRVRLSADPVFHLGTMVSEFTGMAEDYPDMFAAGDGLATLREVQPMSKILQRLLAGLIPIRAEAIDYSVIEIDGEEFIVHNEVLGNVEIERKPLLIVGVTEHMAYWKDLRRVLFSDAEFTMLCRISRDQLQRTWTPVKLADLFRTVTPDLVNQINAAGRVPFGASQSAVESPPINAKMLDALTAYKTALLEAAGKTLTEDQGRDIDAEILRLQERAGSAYEQRAAFGQLHATLVSMTDLGIESSKNLEIRDQARNTSGLPLFPHLTASILQPSTPAPAAEEPDERLLDVEVIAIYW
jgi:hypothetical protein